MEDQLLFFSPCPDIPLQSFVHYLQVKAQRFHAFCWCDELCQVAGFSPQSQLSPILPLRLSQTQRKRAICLVTRQAFEEVVRHYTGREPSMGTIGFEIKGKILTFKSDFERFCRLMPNDLLSLLQATISQRIDQLISAQLKQNIPETTMENLENIADSLSERLDELKTRLNSIKELYKRTNSRLQSLQNVSQTSQYATIYLERLESGKLLAINWSIMPIMCKFQVNWRHIGPNLSEPQLADLEEMEITPGPHILNPIIGRPEDQILQVRLKNDRSMLSNPVKFNVSATGPNLHIAPLT